MDSGDRTGEDLEFEGHPDATKQKIDVMLLRQEKRMLEVSNVFFGVHGSGWIMEKGSIEKSALSLMNRDRPSCWRLCKSETAR